VDHLQNQLQLQPSGDLPLHLKSSLHDWVPALDLSPISHSHSQLTVFPVVQGKTVNSALTDPLGVCPSSGQK